MDFLEKLRVRGSLNLPASAQKAQAEVPTPVAGMNPYAPAVQQPDSVPDVPIDTKMIVEKIDPILGVVEQITGLQRREIFLHLLKAGVKGNGISGFLEGLMGQKPPAEAKFIRYTKTIVTWGLVAIFFGGLILITLMLYASYISHLMAGW